MTKSITRTKAAELAIEDYHLTKEPYYLPIGNEIEVFNKAYQLKLPVMLKGPTGCGKTRFLEYMAWKLGRPLVTVACHEDLTASDLVGRYLLQGGETRWTDGPLSLAVKHGAICYLDEVVEARKDTTVVIHPLTDDRRILPQEKRGLLIESDPNFLLVISYNPGYQSVTKDLKHSTRQRFVGLEFDYPPPEKEADILIFETEIDPDQARSLVRLAQMVRNLRQHGLEEGVSTRLLVYAAKLIVSGISLREACYSAIVWPMTDDPEMQEAIKEIVEGVF